MPSNQRNRIRCAECKRKRQSGEKFSLRGMCDECSAVGLVIAMARGRIVARYIDVGDGELLPVSDFRMISPSQEKVTVPHSPTLI